MMQARYEKKRLQNQDGSIEAYVSERVNRNPMIAAIYARVYPCDRKSNVNIGTKVRNCWGYCSENGWKVAYIFVDQDENKEKTSNLNFKSMIRKARSGDFDVIVFWKLDKFDDSTFSVSRRATINDQCGQSYD